ncbi:uncharacterized protein G2W53_024258 [Senna tora]|uniref:Condensation domain-containing protein n=1 Tax=Senna tora TaxID=362788 RepID=A0A834TAY9_9FABA|nr:uncharacterized protein G2W53_024258 [Senna tora]
MCSNSDRVEALGRSVGGSEYSWCKAVPGGTGITVLALLLSKPPNISRLQTALHKLQNDHPILNSTLHYSTTFSFLTSPTPILKLQSYDISTTSTLLHHSLSPFHQILEYELNRNTWHNPTTPAPVMFASVYALPDAASWVVVLRLHVSTCDRTTAAWLLRELLHNMLTREEEEEEEGNDEIGLAMEDMIPCGMAKKAMWARGMDMLAYSLNSLKLTNLRFEDTKSARCSRVVRLQLNKNETRRLLHGCKEKGIKLCGAVTAAGLMAAHGSRKSSNKYGVVTLIDCRSALHPSPSLHHFGFYHCAILNTHVMKGGESMWEVAKRTYEAFVKSKKCNKHFSDMADLNLLMRKAMENPGLTPSSSLRTSIMSVFEESVIDNINGSGEDAVGLQDLMGCASVHGVGPSMAVFDTIRDGSLDCVCVYPAPLHSTQQMQQMVTTMKAILIQAATATNI